MQTYTIDTPEGYVEMPAPSEDEARRKVAFLRIAAALEEFKATEAVDYLELALGLALEGSR